MMEKDEDVDIVDENLNILYSTAKTKAHASGLLHKTVIGGVFNSNGEIMLVSQLGHRQDPGQFVSPVGGHVMAGESDDEALIREALEEIGTESIKFSLKGKAIFNRFVLNRQENHYFIVYEIFMDENPVLGDEAESFKWFNRDELKEEIKNNPQKFGAAYLFVLENFYPDLLK